VHEFVETVAPGVGRGGGGGRGWRRECDCGGVVEEVGCANCLVFCFGFDNCGFDGVEGEEICDLLGFGILDRSQYS